MDRKISSAPCICLLNTSFFLRSLRLSVGDTDGVGELGMKPEPISNVIESDAVASKVMLSVVTLLLVVVVMEVISVLVATGLSSDDVLSSSVMELVVGEMSDKVTILVIEDAD